MNEPYFQVSEDIILASVDSPELNGDYAIEDILPPGQTFDPYCPGVPMEAGDWAYKLVGIDIPKSHSPGCVWWSQCALRKKHKPSTQSFSNLITNIEPIEA